MSTLPHKLVAAFVCCASCLLSRNRRTSPARRQEGTVSYALCRSNPLQVLLLEKKYDEINDWAEEVKARGGL